MLTKVWIRRFRSIVNVELDLGRMNFFIGANGSGKSNVLEALGVLGAAASGRVNDIRLLKRGVRRSVPRLYRCAFPEEQLCKQDQVQFLALGAKSEGGASYEAKLVPPRTSYETAWSYFAENLSNRRGEAVVLEKKVSLYSEQGRAAPRVKRLKKHSAVALMNTLRRFVIYSPSTPHLRGLIEDVQPREPLGLSGGRLPEGLHEVLAENGESPEIRENFAEVAGLIDWSGGFKAAPNLGDPDSPAAVRSPMLIEFIDRFMAPGANTLTGYDASEGALYVLFCAVLAMHAKAPPCLAIDNIDQALNPLLARELVTAVCRWTAHRKRQWLVTAHNPAVLDGIPLQDESVRLFAVARDSNGHTTVRRIDLKSIEATIREQSGTDWTLSRMWMNGLLGAVPNVYSDPGGSRGGGAHGLHRDRGGATRDPRRCSFRPHAPAARRIGGARDHRAGVGRRLSLVQAGCEARSGAPVRIHASLPAIRRRDSSSRRRRCRLHVPKCEHHSGHRLELVARDIVKHFEERLSTMNGKAMVVCMSRRICVDLYRRIATLRPAWHDPADEMGVLKVVMTGSASDPQEWQGHIRSKGRREDLAKAFRDPANSFRIVIVRDMWLTGFDAPSLHTMYVDKPMRGHGLMQAIARVNRVFKDKPGGLVVDYIGFADALKQALVTYTESGGTGKTAIDQADAVVAMQEKYEVCCGLFHGLDRSKWTAGVSADRLSLLAAGQEHVLALADGKARVLRAVTDLSHAFALAVPHEDALRIRDDVGFFQSVRAVLAKNAPGEQKSDEELDHAIRQIVSKAVSSDEVIDIFAAAGLKKPDISILSDEFLADVRGMPQRNLAVELLRKLLSGEIKSRSRRNVVQGRSFADLLEQAIRRYQNRAIETAQVIEALIELAKEMRKASARGAALGLTEDEVAFYDALEVNDSAVKVLGDATLRGIARELVATIRKNVTIDWTLRENVRANLRVAVKRILRKYGYPPDKQEKATQTVIEQAEVLCRDWASA